MNPDFNANDYLNDEELAVYLGCTNVLALRYERKGGVLPAPDTVFEGRAYWSPDSAKNLFAERLSAIHQAFGRPKTEPSEAPDPLNHSGVVMLRFQEGRWSSRPVDDEGDHGMNLKGWV